MLIVLCALWLFTLPGCYNSCDSPWDGDCDGVDDMYDNCVNVTNPGQEDVDNDWTGDACDNCVDMSNPTQSDFDMDGIGDACDNCPCMSNPDQMDTDGDGMADNCECGCSSEEGCLGQFQCEILDDISGTGICLPD